MPWGQGGTDESRTCPRLIRPPNDSRCDVEIGILSVKRLLTGLEDDGVSTRSAGLLLHLG